jgi:hypothetical protein
VGVGLYVIYAQDYFIFGWSLYERGARCQLAGIEIELATAGSVSNGSAGCSNTHDSHEGNDQDWQSIFHCLNIPLMAPKAIMKR